MGDSKKPDHKPSDNFHVDDLKTLKVLVHPLRLKIIECLRETGTAKSVAAALGVKYGNIYYHIKQLLAHGLIMVEREEKRTRYFRASARRYRLNWQTLAPQEPNFARRFEQTLGGIFIGNIEDARDSVMDGVIETGENPALHRRLLLNSGRANLTRERAEAFYRKLEALIEEYGFAEYDTADDEDDDAQLYRILLLLHPSSRN